MSIFAWYGYEGSLHKRALALKERGFSSLSLWWEEEDNKSPEENLQSLRRLDMKIELVHLPYFPGGLWGGQKRLFEEAFLRSLEQLHRGEIPLVVFHPTSFEELELPLDEGGLELAYKLGQRARVLGINLAVENLQQDPHLFGLLESLDIALCLDTGHMGISGNYEGLKKYFHRIKALHLHDNDGKKDLHLIPGDGVLPLDKWLKQVPQGLDYHLEINRGLSDYYEGYDERGYLERAKKSLSILGGWDEKKF